MTAAAAAPIIHQAIAKSLAPRRPLTVSQWADAERVLSAKGSAEPGRWRTERNPPLREPMDAMSARSGVRDVVLMFPIQFGKALALDTPIPTPTGWIAMGNIGVGADVFGPDGAPRKVVGVSEVFEHHDCYRVTFSDRTSVVADGGHRWSVIDMGARHRARKELKDRESRIARKRKPLSADLEANRLVLDTTELARMCAGQRQSRLAIPVTAPLQMPMAVLPIDPYLLGLWLGDGHTHYAAITTMDTEVAEAFRQSGYELRRHKHQSAGKATTYGVLGLNCQLREAGLLRNKHIPMQYLRASLAQREALLQGLMDTDGFCGASAEITSSNPALAAGIMELLRTLGYKPTIRWRKTTGQDSGRITFGAFRGSAIFRLPRKLATLPAAPSARGAHMAGLRYIISVERVPSVATRCIAVDSPDRLYLCGEGMVATHNTEIAVNLVGYTMDHNPGPIMVCLPGEVSMNKWVMQKLTPMIEETPAAARALTSTASRDSANTRFFKDFAGGQLYLEHAGSPSRLKSTTVRTLIADELDEFAANLLTGDDPVALLDGRTSAFPSTAKRIYISTPGLTGTSRIHNLYLRSDQRRYYVPCPHCEHLQPLEWAGLHWSPDGAQCWYGCRECGAVIDEHHKTRMIAAGRWVAENPAGKIRGYHINCLYYPLGLGPRWLDLVEMWRGAQNDPAKLKTFINDRLAEPWEDPAMRAVKHNIIADRAEPYRLRVAPAGVLACTAGVDTQDNRLAVQIIGWGRGLQAWTLDYVELPGDPADQAVWLALVDLLSRPIEHANGWTTRVEATAIDAGGHRTEAVKDFVRRALIRRPMCIFGATPNNAPVLGKAKLQDVNWGGKLDRRGVHIYQVGTVAAKHWLYSRLSTDAEKPIEARLVHLSDELPPEYFAGLVSETYNPSKNRFEKRTGARNEPLDTWVYSYAATFHPELRLYRRTKADWDAAEAHLARGVPREPGAEPAPSVPRETKQVPPSGGWVSNRRGWIKGNR